MTEFEACLAKLLSDIRALPEEQMCFALLGRRLKGFTTDEAALFFETLYKRAPSNRTARRLCSMLVNHEALCASLGETACKRIYMASLELGLTRVSRLFTDLAPHKKAVSGYDNEEESPMEFMPLGQRRAMAKCGVKDTLDRLLSDPDPLVINNILNNPRITEREALKIASKRPNSARILKLLAGHGRWGKRHDVIKAITMNPYTPPRISIGLLELLLTQDMREIATDAALHPQVRLSARELLEVSINATSKGRRTEG